MMYRRAISSEWKEEGLSPFDELLLSWNAPRPLEGEYLFYVSILVGVWSPWLLYARWGSQGQKSFFSEAPCVRIDQDTLEVTGGKRATGFQVRVVAEGKASLGEIRGLHVYTNSDQQSKEMGVSLAPIHLPVRGISQMKVSHARHRDLCSPTATTAALRYLLGDDEIDPVELAQNVWDGGFDLFGNWVFAVAEAAGRLGREWDCWVERLNGFEQIHERLRLGTPVITSVRGPLPGSALPYDKGHLLAVIGYDPEKKRVLCVDSAFAEDEKTQVSYDLTEFVQAWDRRGRVAYLFHKK